jgi:hypothetical protein
MGPDDSCLPLCIHGDARIFVDVRPGIVSVTRESLMPKMIVAILAKVELSASFQ